MKKVIGMDLGDKKNVIVVFDEEGNEVVKRKIANTAQQLQKFFAKHPGAAVVIEAGTHSPWISRLLSGMGHEVCVGNPRKLRAIWDADDKSDERDARILAMMYRLEPRLLHAIHHRGEQAQADLEMIKARDTLVRTRASLVNHARGTVKTMGYRIPACSVEAFASRAPAQIPTSMWDALAQIVETITELNGRVKQLDKQIAYLCRERYPETKYLLQVAGVGADHRLGLRADHRDARSLREEPHRRGLPGADATAGPIGRDGSADADHQGRQPLPAPPTRRLRSLHPRSVRSGLRPAPVRGPHRCPWRQTSEEVCLRCRRTQTGGETPPAVGGCRRIRTADV